jgi:hypothetical protein
MPDDKTQKGKCRMIKKMRIHEVSLAAQPMNQFPYLTIKEGGKLMPTAVYKLVASLALKSQEISEAVKEELKAIAAKDITFKDFLEAMRDLGFKEDSFIPDGMALIKKDEVVNRETHDIVPKGTWTAKEKDKYAELSPDVRKEIEDQKKEIESLKETNLKKDLSVQVGEEVAKELTPFFSKITKEQGQFIVSTITGLQKAVKELGGKKGLDTSEKEAVVTKEQMDKEVKEIAEKEKISETDAMVLWAERNPEKAAKLAA